jgi:uncharacterized protein YjbI with pentapeptide repeats
MDIDILKAILDKHKAWLYGEPGGERAYLSRADLRFAELHRADLRGAHLRYADLHGADLRGADLRGADLCGANLCGANMSRANLCGAYLREANLCGADLRFADLREADLNGADLRSSDLSEAENLDAAHWNIMTAFYPMQCPESGSYIAYKKAANKIVELLIPADAKRSSATTRKCRASKAHVLSITTFDGAPAGQFICSDYDSSFVYTVGETVEVEYFDENRWNECAPGIHHFITRAEAVKY